MKKKIMFVFRGRSSWLDRDQRILSEKYDVDAKDFSKLSQYLSFTWIKALITSDLIFIWFGSFAFLPIIILAKAFNKKMIVVAGGFDVAKVPAIHYGGFLGPWPLPNLRAWIFKSADKIICVSKSNMRQTVENAGVDLSKCVLIYHGFEQVDATINIRPWHERKNRAVLIASCDEKTFLIKGVDQFIEVAKATPDYEFIFIGNVTPEFKDLFDRTAPSNFRSTGFLKFRCDEFNEVLNSSKFVLQLSYHESFGCSVIDAALMGCYPIVSTQYALPEIVEGIGQAVAHGNVMKVKELIHEVNKEGVDTKGIGQKALRKFTLESRISALCEIVEKTLSH